MRIVKQLNFRPSLPTVLNNADDQRRESELKRIEEIVRLSGIEDQFVEASVKTWLKECDESEVSAQALGALNHALLKQGAQPAQQGAQQALGLKTKIELDEVWMDSTAVKAPIHYPVDWVLPPDATRTLRKAVGLIRKRGLKHRREEPARFLARMNALCIEMCATRRRKDSQRTRKRVFGLMKKLMKQIKAHAARHQDLLRAHWAETDWSQAQAQRVIERIEGVLQQLPQQSVKKALLAKKIENPNVDNQ